MKTLRIVGLAACVVTSGAKPLPPVLAHNGPWDVHTSENACMLARTFGSGAQEASVAFQPLFNAINGELLVATGDWKGGQRIGTASIELSPSGAKETVRYFSNRVAEKEKRITRLVMPLSVWQRLSQTDVLTISAPPVNIRIRLVRFEAAHAAFQKCERDLLTEWGVDPGLLDSDAGPTPLKNPGYFFSPDDYPISAMRAGHVGRVVTILNVDAAGLVSECRIGSSSWPDLNEATCKQARRVRFNPAHDAAGRAVPGIFILPVRWSMGGF